MRRQLLSRGIKKVNCLEQHAAMDSLGRAAVTLLWCSVDVYLSTAPFMKQNLEIFKGTVRSGRGGAVAAMSKPEELQEWETLTGLKVIPGTLNLLLSEPFNLSLLKYLRFSEIGWEFDPASQGIDFAGDIGMYYSRITIAGRYPGILAFWTWVLELKTNAELISPVHLRTTMGIEDGDVVNFSLYTDH